IDCPAILICGEKDQAGSAKSYNRRWAQKEGLPVYWISGAGHNSNTDRPEEVNRIIREFVMSLGEKDNG
ncbi:MAG: alpha/beta hydrolase, partial [Oscillospiraceae bacterium]|nr:alpha/beta hydrolase [Oscillospiraceae bacterium]